MHRCFDIGHVLNGIQFANKINRNEVQVFIGLKSYAKEPEFC